MLVAILRMHPKQLTIKDVRKFGRVWGNDEVLREIRRGRNAAEIEAGWAGELEQFGQRRAKYLIYQ